MSPTTHHIRTTGVLAVESDIPRDLTLAEWRASRAKARPRRRWRRRARR
jgi:hypothetical protein